MNIVMITTNDPAGVAITFTQAINRYTDHHCRLVTTETRYNFMYEKDLHLPWLSNMDELRDVLEKADVIHFHMGSDETMSLGSLDLENYVEGKEVVHHHHGEPAFRANPDSFRLKELQLGRRAIVSTPDLLKLYPEATWMPNPVPMNDPDYLPLASRSERERVLVGHSPTRKELKNTADFLDVTRKLGDRYGRMETVVIENTPHRECLRIKKQCGAFFDHMQGYYGVSSLEALSQGVPTIAGLDDWNTHHLQEATGSSRLPWLRATNADELAAQIENLVNDESRRARLGRISREWMERYWTEQRWAERLVQVYQTAGVGV